MPAKNGRRSFVENWGSLYANQTPAEQELEPHIAALGVRYRCQHPFWGLKTIADFILPDFKVIFEVDDESHNRKAKREADAEKTVKYNRLGWTVVRCKNAEAIENPGKTLNKMLMEANLGHLIKNNLEEI